MTRTRTTALVLCTALALVAVSVVFQPLLAQAPDRSRPPAVGAPPALTLPPVARRMLSNGVPVWLVETHDVPLVQVDLVIMAGSADDPAGKYGTAVLSLGAGIPGGPEALANQWKIAEDEAAKQVGAPVRIAGYLRFALGEGIEKKSEDFAAEVAAQLKK